MRRLLACLSLSLGPVLAQPQPPAFVGPPLPSNYEAQNVYRGGSIQVITAKRDNPNVDALAIARDIHTGQTLWKIYTTGVLVPEPVGRGQGVVIITAIRSGAITRAETFLLRLGDGKLLRRGLFKVPGVREGKALLVTYGDVPPSDPFLSDPSRLTGEVMDTVTGRTLTRNFPIPRRPGCGDLKRLSIISNMQTFELNGSQLLVPREDKCGKFQAVFEWTKVPLPRPAF